MNKTITSLFLMAFCLSSGVAYSAEMIFGGGDHARRCYMAAVQVSRLGMGDEGAIEECTLSLEKETLTGHDKAATYVNRGILRVANDQLQEAVQDYNKALALSPNMAAAYGNRANLWYMSGYIEEAVKEYNKAIEINSEDASLYLNRGMAYEKLQRFSEAQQDYQRALELIPEWSKATERLAELPNQN